METNRKLIEEIGSLTETNRKLTEELEMQRSMSRSYLDMSVRDHCFWLFWFLKMTISLDEYGEISWSRASNEDAAGIERSKL